MSPCFVGWVQGNMPKRKPPSNVSTVWNVDQRFEQMGIHPTQKPVELFIRPIEYHTEPGEIVYEPFSGSGTQIVAAERTGRVCFAVEQEPAYIDVAVARWEAFTGLEATKERVEEHRLLTVATPTVLFVPRRGWSTDAHMSWLSHRHYGRIVCSPPPVPSPPQHAYHPLLPAEVAIARCC